jgi:hypothetical protein
MSQEPAEEWFRGYAKVTWRIQEASARARYQVAYAEDVLAHLYLIRGRLATMELEAAALQARIQSG